MILESSTWNACWPQYLLLGNDRDILRWDCWAVHREDQIVSCVSLLHRQEEREAKTVVLVIVGFGRSHVVLCVACLAFATNILRCRQKTV
jgi:hypothetical protein